MALAGLHLMDGKTQKQALMQAGYAESTARRPTANNLTAQRCIQAAAEVFPEADPSHLVQQARRALGKKLDQLVNDPKYCSEQRPGEVARIVEVVEKAHGHRVDGGGKDLDPRTFAERVVWLQQLKLELDKLTGQNVGELPSPAAAVDVEVEKG